MELGLGEKKVEMGYGVNIELVHQWSLWWTVYMYHTRDHC